MKISGLTVCVSYADYLAKSIDRWVTGLDSLLVVSTPTDSETFNLCQFHKCSLYQTEVFYQNGAVFNKGAAISEAVEACNWLDDWNLIFDADIIPLPHWRGIVETSGIQPGNLYGAKRVMEDGSDNRHDYFELPGYFQLFHASDPNVQRKPLLDCGWVHAGGYDSEFQGRWPGSRKHRLPMTLIHQGQTGRNWWGRGNEAAMDAMLAERQKRRKLAENERMRESI